jgi:hypothetical protein
VRALRKVEQLESSSYTRHRYQRTLRRARGSLPPLASFQLGPRPRGRTRRPGAPCTDPSSTDDAA